MTRYEARLGKLKDKIAIDDNDIDGLFINNPSNVAYLTGLKGNEIYLFITQEESAIITDFRYREAVSKIDWFKYEEIGNGRSISDVIASYPCKTIGFERNSLSYSQYADFVEKLPDRKIAAIGPNAEMSGLVEDLRMIKDDYEMKMTSKAEKIGCDAFNYILGYIKPGMTEIQIAREIEHYMLTHGGEALSFDTICVAGVNSSLPHGVPSNYEIKDGDFLTMDFGCKYNGYCSDMTRTVAIGHATDEMKDVYNIVLEAQQNACSRIKTLVKGDAAHRYASDIIEKAGYGEFFGHGLGHGTGLDIHENPRFSPSYTKPIPEGCICSIEPGIYLPGKFGVRIEDLAIISGNGIINLALSASKELIII